MDKNLKLYLENKSKINLNYHYIFQNGLINWHFLIIILFKDLFIKNSKYHKYLKTYLKFFKLHVKYNLEGYPSIDNLEILYQQIYLYIYKKFFKSYYNHLMIY